MAFAPPHRNASVVVDDLGLKGVILTLWNRIALKMLSTCLPSALRLAPSVHPQSHLYSQVRLFLAGAQISMHYVMTPNPLFFQLCDAGAGPIGSGFSIKLCQEWTLPDWSKEVMHPFLLPGADLWQASQTLSVWQAQHLTILWDAPIWELQWFLFHQKAASTDNRLTVLSGNFFCQLKAIPLHLCWLIPCGKFLCHQKSAWSCSSYGLSKEVWISALKGGREEAKRNLSKFLVLSLFTFSLNFRGCGCALYLLLLYPLEFSSPSNNQPILLVKVLLIIWVIGNS
jgi:hypothetical protein